jgi:hypothetical protein
MRISLPLLAAILSASTLATADEPAPPPRGADPDPRRPARLEVQRKDPDPVLRGLARRDIAAGDAVQPIIKDNPHYEVFRCGDYVVLTFDPTGYGGTRVIAKDGKLIAASTSSCIYHDTFFEVMTEAERGAAWVAYDKEYKTRINAKLTLPAVVGTAAGFVVWRRPAVPK